MVLGLDWAIMMFAIGELCHSLLIVLFILRCFCVYEFVCVLLFLLLLIVVYCW